MQDRPSSPVTVSVRRRVAPERASQAQAWMSTGMHLASHFPGFLGCGWLREHADGEHWSVLYRFQDRASLEAWERSPERDGWLAAGASWAAEVDRAHRTGVEGWFDMPRERAAQPVTGIEGASIDDAAADPIPPAPPRWKQMLVIFLGFLPLTLAANLLLPFVPGWNDLPVAVRVTLITVMLTPTMTFVVLPALTHWLRGWLAGTPRTRP